MIVLLDTNHPLDTCARELDCAVGQLLTPLTRFTLREPGRPWAIDNGAFSRFNATGFLSLLEREKHHQENCLFVAVPDVVGSARRTLEAFERWKGRLSGWKLALVCQDGQEDLPIPWEDIAAVFIGGSTAWKCSPQSAACIKAAKALGKWAHVGRVNHASRFRHFEDLGADSIDGSGLAQYSHMREAIAKRHYQGELYDMQQLPEGNRGAAEDGPVLLGTLQAHGQRAAPDRQAAGRTTPAPSTGEAA